MNKKSINSPRRAGRPYGRTKVKIAITLDKDVWADARVAVMHLGRSLSDLINEQLEAWLSGDDTAPVQEIIIAARKSRRRREVAA
ncbi:hypothetical protein Ga0100231_005035 [Opitutaceae bacterium TAV4]|nr:hypothetical protein Ga0100231_005035 [Opitutaceae bacterium TAV4]